MKNSLLLIWINCIAILAQGQGLVVDFDRYKQIPRLSDFGDGSKSVTDADYKSKVDLRPYCPTPQQQGSMNSCTGWAVGYGALTILKAIKEDWKDLKDSINQNAFSALFIYNQVKKGITCDAGSDIIDAGKLLMEKGNLKSQYFDRFKNQCDRLPSSEELEIAKPFKIKGFVTVFGQDDPEYTKINMTKLSLAQLKPVVIGMEIRASLRELKWADQYWFPGVGNQRHEGSHAMVVVGYDDGKEAFEIMNSWGPNWGDKGFFWIKYKDFAQLTFFAYQFSLEEPSRSTNSSITSAINFRRIIFGQNNEVKFQSEKVTFNGRFYESISLKKGSLVQPYIEQINRGVYLYMFTFDPTRKITLYYPKDTIRGGPKIEFHQTRMAVPSDSIALGFNTLGDEYICFLIAKKPILNLSKYLKQLGSLAPTDFVKNLYTVFGKQMEPLLNLQYQKEGCSIVSEYKAGVIAPLVIRCKVVP